MAITPKLCKELSIKDELRGRVVVVELDTIKTDSVPGQKIFSYLYTIFDFVVKKYDFLPRNAIFAISCFRHIP